jgi:hypothetical protein
MFVILLIREVVPQVGTDYPANIPSANQFADGFSQLNAGTPQAFFVNLVGIASGCPPPISTSIDQATFSYQASVPIDNLFAFTLSNHNNPTEPLPLDSRYDFATLLPNYLNNLAEAQAAINRCGSTDVNCRNRVAIRLELEAQNRFDDWIYISATSLQNPIPPLMLKLVLMQESQMTPALSGNNAGAVGIAQFTTIAAQQLVNDQHDIEVELYYGVSINDGTQMKTYLDGLRNNCSNSSSELTCVDFFEVQMAIQEAAYLLSLNRYRFLPSYASFANFSDQDKWLLTLAAYNWGAGPESLGGILQDPNVGTTFSAICPQLPAETRKYVRNIRFGTPNQDNASCW